MKTAVLLIHGFPLDHTIWERQARALESDVRVMAPDLRGFGGSEGGPGVPALRSLSSGSRAVLDGGGGWTMENFAQDLLRLIDGAGVDRFIPVGHSMGGYILFALHRLAPGRLAGAVFVSTRAAADSPDVRARREETARAVLEKGVEVVEESMLPRLFAPGAAAEAVDKARAAVRRATRSGVAAALRGMAARPDATPQLPYLDVPALVIAGQQDAIVPPAESEAMARSLPRARLDWCRRSGHMPMLEEPDAVAEALAVFLRSV